MLFKGKNYRRSHKAYPLPREMWKNGYVTFGRLCKEGDKGAVESDYKWSSGERVYLRPVKARGHSLTNLMYGADGYSYLMLDGAVYVAKTKVKERDDYCQKLYDFEGSSIRPLFYETDFCKSFEASVEGLDDRQRKKAFMKFAREVFDSFGLTSTEVKFNKHRDTSYYSFLKNRAAFSEANLYSPARFAATVIHEAAHAFEDVFMDDEDSDGEIHGRLFAHVLLKLYKQASGLNVSEIRVTAKEHRIRILSHAKYVDQSDSFFDQFEGFTISQIPDNV